MDIIVTTPKNETDASKQEAEKIKKDGGGFYFRRFTRLPCNLNIGGELPHPQGMGLPSSFT